MVLTSLQAKMLINQFSHLDINQPVQMVGFGYVISPFEGDINTVDPTGINIYLQSTKNIYKETDKLDISISNYK